MNPFHDILEIGLSISHNLRLGFPRDLYPSQATCTHFSSPQCVSSECIVKNDVREETICITIQRMSLITLMIVKDSDVRGKGILELTEIFLVRA
jgi:hypothetical protein